MSATPIISIIFGLYNTSRLATTCFLLLSIQFTRLKLTRQQSNKAFVLYSAQHNVLYIITQSKYQCLNSSYLRFGR